MNRVLLGLASLLAASTSFGFETWLGVYQHSSVNTELGNATETEGRWFVISDSIDGGESSIIWPAELGNEYSPTDVTPVLERCDGLCGTAMLEKGFDYPYAMVAFNVVEQTSDTDTTSASGDASNWGGLCITYRSTARTTLQLGLGEKVDHDMEYGNPYVTLPVTNKDTSLQFKWSDFKQPTWVSNKGLHISGEDAVKQLVAIHFRMQDVVGTYDFNICAIGPYNGGCPERCSEIVSQRWLSHDSITISDIPDQPYTGDSICPEVVITDHHKFDSKNAEDRLVLGSDYTVKCENNVNTGLARMVIKANDKAGYLGTVVKYFNIVDAVQYFGALSVHKNQIETWAVIDGDYDGKDTVKVDSPIKVNRVAIKREFTRDAYSTIMFPFDVNTDILYGVAKVLAFAGISQDSVTGAEQVEVDELWDWYGSFDSFTLKANTPYIIKTSDSYIAVQKAVTIEKTTEGLNVGEVTPWEFRGTYSYKTWDEDELKYRSVYGFAAREEGDYAIGDFVKVGAGASINPMRAYIVFNPPKPLKGAQISSSEKEALIQSLPENMEVVVVNKDGEQTTVIGTLNTRTGVIRMSREHQSYDLNGRNLKGKPKANGAYYGKKTKF